MNHYDTRYFKELRKLAERHKNFDVLDYDHIEVDRETFFTKKSNISIVEDYYCDVFDEVPDESIREMDCFLDKTVVKEVNQTSIVVDMFLNVHDRFHRFEKRIPKSAFEVSLYVYSYDKRPYLFLKDEWVDRFWSSSYSTYVFIDLIGFKNYMQNEVELNRGVLEKLNRDLDDFVKEKDGLSIISVSDSIILKKNYGIREAYENYTPEELIFNSIEIRNILKQNLGLDSFAIFTQGFNEYSSPNNFHLGANGNHVSLLSSGAPYVDMYDIEVAASKNQKQKIHPPCSCYFHEDFFLSINFDYKEHDWRSKQIRHKFNSRSSIINTYIALNESDFLHKLKVTE